MNDTRRQRGIHKQKVHGFLRVGIVGLGLVPCFAVTEATMLICLIGLGLAVVVAIVV